MSKEEQLACLFSEFMAEAQFELGLPNLQCCLTATMLTPALYMTTLQIIIAYL